ncbi:MAG: hypothetical protein E6H78_05990 [Betaproteobacteria bacterium]|nr:MAG: hypothetical protein E6H78_05990 [Betaproteobacteria bacterium]
MSINTVTNLLVDVGAACADYQNTTLRNLQCKRIQCGEVWGFCYAKERNIPVDNRGQPGYGDVWPWTAICADTKLVPSWLVGRRDAFFAHSFAADLASRLSSRVQLTTDGHHIYLSAIEGAFGVDVD